MSSGKLAHVALVGMLAASQVSAANIYNESTYRGLANDHRALRVGDTITVLIYESATAESSTDADTNKKSAVGIGASDGFTGINGDLNIHNDFQGGGTLSRSDAVAAKVSVTVTEVLAGGDLKISGHQEIEFNEEAQYISVEGRVRPADISPDNVVLSTRIADARIKYIGDGLLSDRQSPGWLTRFFNWLF